MGTDPGGRAAIAQEIFRGQKRGPNMAERIGEFQSKTVKQGWGNDLAQRS